MDLRQFVRGKKCSMFDYLTWKSKGKKRSVTPILSPVTKRVRVWDRKIQGGTQGEKLSPFHRLRQRLRCALYAGDRMAYWKSWVYSSRSSGNLFFDIKHLDISFLFYICSFTSNFLRCSKLILKGGKWKPLRTR